MNRKKSPIHIIVRVASLCMMLFVVTAADAPASATCSANKIDCAATWVCQGEQGPPIGNSCTLQDGACNGEQGTVQCGNPAAWGCDPESIYPEVIICEPGLVGE
jgi:hypothetical protein